MCAIKAVTQKKTTVKVTHIYSRTVKCARSHINTQIYTQTHARTLIHTERKHASATTLADVKSTIHAPPKTFELLSTW